MSNQQGDLPPNLEEALKVMLSTRDAARRAFGPNNPEGLFFENALGFLYARMGKFAEAREVLAPLEERFVKVLGPDHIDLALYHENLALAEEGLHHREAAEGLLKKSYELRKNKLSAGHGLTRRAAAHLSRVYMGNCKTEEAVRWMRVLMTAGVVRNGRVIARPGTSSTPEPRGVADINLLGDALAGKAQPNIGDALLNELSVTLDWLLWRSDWLRAYIRYRLFENMCRLGGLSAEQIRKNTGNAIGVTRFTLSIMEANPATPPRLLDEARVRLKQLIEAEAKAAQSR